MTATEQQIIRRSTRLLAAIHELHKQGYQNLTIFSGMSSSGFHWRLQLYDFYDLTKGAEHPNEPQHSLDYEVTSHSSGDSGNLYFGWQDTTNVSARELAEKIKERFPRLISQCKAENFDYAGWFTYMLGKAENGALPVMYRDYYHANEGFIASTKKQELTAPPHCKLLEVNGRQFIYANPRHLTKSDDWHTAYISIVNDIRSANIAKFPSYPEDTSNVCEMGAYWEGAIYYIQHVLGFTRIDKFLLAAENYDKSSEPWSSFFLIWNNFQQFGYLKAFLIRKMFSQEEEYSMTAKEHKKWKDWWHNFTEENSDTGNGRPQFHNPYFGGTNPLHLGGILNQTDSYSRDNLISV